MTDAAGRLPPARSAPRIFAAAAEALAAYAPLGATARRANADEIGFWSFGLTAALSARPGLVESPSQLLPESFAHIRAAQAQHIAVPRLAFAILHLPAMLTVAMLMEEAHRMLNGTRPYVLVQRRNFGTMGARLAGMVTERVEVVYAGPQGIRRLGRVLASGQPMRLMIFPDGPARPDAPRARSIATVGEGLLFHCSALRVCFRHGVPVVPIIHYFEAGRLVVQPQPIVRPDATGSDPLGHFLASALAPLGTVLRTRPEQWLCWPGVAIRR